MNNITMTAPKTPMPEEFNDRKINMVRIKEMRCNKPVQKDEI